MSTPEISRYRELGDLQDLLLKVCPPGEAGKKSIPVLAKKLGVTHQYLYRWIAENTVPAKFVPTLVSLSDGRATIEEFHPYVFGVNL